MKFSLIIKQAGVFIAFLCIAFSYLCSYAFAQNTQPTETTQQKVLTLYNWADYLGPDTLKNFEAETGIKVQELYFDDEEEIMGAIISNPSAYDLVVTSGDHLRAMREAKMLAEIDYSKIENFKHIGDKYRNMFFDPQQKYSVPYLIGTTGVVINTKYIPEDTTSWAVLYDEKYKGRIGMLNNVYEVAATAAKQLGYSINPTDKQKLEEIHQFLLKQQPLIHGYHGPDKMIELMRDETIWVAHQYSGESLELMDEDEKFIYFIPQEGAPIWIDSFAIPRRSKLKDEAHVFLNYILRPDVNAEIASHLWNATPNEAAEKLLDKELLESEGAYPPEKVKARCEFFGNIGEADATYYKIWRDLKLNK